MVAIGISLLWVVPRTSILGASRLTGDPGGAVSILRVGNPLCQTLFPVYFGALVWPGRYFREAR